ncbi:cytochrome P450 [Bombardia bombarda]|uniref:Cytochrome P450 n=1 Tax=Bombardia bombarda TaxID=252184 RepID=A0AA39XHU6_9PEZI|nr:cytochrome P450 [Bombardia bombarda]
MKGKGWPKWARFMIKDWYYEDKGRAHDEFGEVFLVVSPGDLVCYVAAAKTAMNITSSQRKVFLKMREKTKMLDLFGPSVATTNGDAWRFHLRITLPPFGDALRQLVWVETRRQASMLAKAWTKNGVGQQLKHGIYLLTVNVASLANFGRRGDWTDGPENTPPNHKLSLAAAITLLNDYLGQILLMPKWLLAAQGVTEPDGRTGFTNKEIKGNLFLFLAAGYETTANSMLSSCIFLALHGDIQDRIIEEVDCVHHQAIEVSRVELSYTDDMPKFRYLTSFMYESLRVFTIVQSITRKVYEPQNLLVHDSSTGETRNVQLPAGTAVIINNVALHFLPLNWPSPHVLEPRRWLVSEPNTFDPLEKPTAAQEADMAAGTTPIPNHERGTFMAFNEGLRACLGRIFAKAEFVAFFAHMLRDHRFELDEDVSPADVERIMRLRSGGSVVTLTPSENVRVRLVPRKK